MPRPRLKPMLRISLRTVFVLTTILCIGIGFKVHQVKQQRDAVAWVEKHGGHVAYGYDVTLHHNGGRIVHVDEAPRAKWLSHLVGVDYFTKPIYVGLCSNSELDDLSPLVNVPELKMLAVSSEQVKDLSPLAELQELKYLFLGCPKVHDLSPLAALKKLEILILPKSTTDEEITGLQKMLPDCSIAALLELE